MSDEPKCVCGCTAAEHNAVVEVSHYPESRTVETYRQCMTHACRCFRPCLPWPDAEGWWWSKATGHCLHAVRSIPKTFVVLKYNEVYQQHEWDEEGGPDSFCRCEENPFKGEA